MALTVNMYTVFLVDNKTVKASPAQGNQVAPLQLPGNAFTRTNLSQSKTTVNSSACGKNKSWRTERDIV